MLVKDHEANIIKFWARAFGCSNEELVKSDLSIVSNGVYVEKHADKYAFFYHDQIHQKTVLAASTRIIEEITKDVGVDRLSQLNYDSILSEPWFKSKKVAFSDIDLCLLDMSAFTPTNEPLDFRRLDDENDELEDFYQDCTEDDRDTLDLTFDGEIAYGLYHVGGLAAVSRYLRIKETNLADITVLVRKSQRGRGLSVPLVSKVVEAILEDGLLPKYRVSATNAPSIAVAKRLGFRERFRLIAWETDTEDHN